MARRSGFAQGSQSRYQTAGLYRGASASSVEEGYPCAANSILCSVRCQQKLLICRCKAMLPQVLSARRGCDVHVVGGGEGLH